MCALRKIIWAILFGEHRQYSTWKFMVMVNFLASVVQKLICNYLC